ncbi:GNAT family N-acetyltransferase [Microlunatus soli]|uniref:Acetyltransferase (GNAT) family protein n=1 Tax=Microlunatus soli TaxID=630515 RepID=A0A1H2A7J3_9ACTN|nr:GNAT family N-acetyltransferase [Microlunatus soli]SDT41945.1 Acetyltransferase (GNAT) family protein [Microlunatus soli]
MTLQDAGRTVRIRPADQPGDLGWVVMAHGEAYHRQFDWNADFEALVARVVADFAADHDPDREAGWIAELDGRRVGSIFLVGSDDPMVAKLRILLVTPDARGHRIGTLLVRTCLQFARRAGYRSVTLWTNSVLTAARRIYQGFGFELRQEDRHHSFGHDLVGQHWDLVL